MSVPPSLRPTLRPSLRQRAGRLRLLAGALATRPAAVRRLPLALVVPVWNDAPGLARLLTRVGALGLFDEVVVVDDGSDPALPLPRVRGAQVRLIRHDSPQGGGVARNAGMSAVTRPYMMYLDADDLPAPDLPDLIADLADDVAASGPFDLCLFKHADSRTRPEARWGQPAWDEARWRQAGHATGALAPALPGALPVLAMTANYPWNKVYRTALLRDNGIGCVATMVHQDIPLHWLALMAADRVLVSDRICVWHGVDLPLEERTGARPGTHGDRSPVRARLTQRTGDERLQVFAAFDPVVPAAAAAGQAWQAALAAFVPELIDWAEGRIAPALVPRLRAAEAAWLADRIGPWLPALTDRDPALAALIGHRIAEGAGAPPPPTGSGARRDGP